MLSVQNFLHFCDISAHIKAARIANSVPLLGNFTESPLRKCKYVPKCWNVPNDHISAYQLACCKVDKYHLYKALCMWIKLA